MDELKETVQQLAAENYDLGLNCVESVYDALLRCGVLKADPATLAMCTGFGGGIGLSGLTCGALTGAAMAMSAVFGRDPWSMDEETRRNQLYDSTYRRFNKLANDFAEINGSALCREITQPWRGSWSDDGRKEVCRKAVISAAGLAFDQLRLTPEEAAKIPWGDNVAGRS